MKKIFWGILLALLMVTPAMAFTPAEYVVASSTYNADAAVVSEACYLYGFQMSPNSTSGVTITIYDSADASGVSPVALFFSGVSPYTAPMIRLPGPVFMKTGIYVDHTGAGSYIIYYRTRVDH